MGPSLTYAVLPWNFPNQRWMYCFFISDAKLQVWPQSCCGHICGHITGLRDETNKGARSRRERQAKEEERDLDTDDWVTEHTSNSHVTYMFKTKLYLGPHPYPHPHPAFLFSMNVNSVHPVTQTKNLTSPSLPLFLLFHIQSVNNQLTLISRIYSESCHFLLPPCYLSGPSHHYLLSWVFQQPPT